MLWICCRRSICRGFVVDLLYNLLYNKSTTNRISGVWASQNMLDKCSELAKLLSLEFNVEKLHCIALRCVSVVTQLSGVELLNILVCIYKVVDFSSLISLLPNELLMLLVILFLCMVLELTKLRYYAYKWLIVYVYWRMPFLLSLSLIILEIDELNICWNSVVRKVFGYHKWKSVSAVLLGLCRLNVKHLIMLRKVKFCRHLLHDCDAFLCDVFNVFTT